MELKFTKEHGGWVSEFEATADFNLHVEGVYEGNVSIYQRGTAGGGYAFVKDSRPAPSAGTVYDYDFTSLVYPKFIKVVCTEEPTYAEIVTTGEVTELKHQSKAVEITANGTTSIAPDAGFAALNAVEVKVNVPTSGGASGGASNLRFFKVEEFPVDEENEWMIAAYVSTLKKATFRYAPNVIEISCTPLGFPSNTDYVYAVAIQMDVEIRDNYTIENFLQDLGEDWFNGLLEREITKEEFYTL